MPGGSRWRLSQSQSDLGFSEVSLPVEMVTQQPLVKYCFKTKFDLKAFTKWEKTGTETVTKTRTERRWYTLWLVEHEVTYKVPHDVYEHVKYTSATVPSVEQLIDLWVEQAQERDTDLVRHMVDWLIAQIRKSTEALQRTQETMLERYEARLRQAHAAAEQLHDFEQLEWGSVRDQANSLKSCLARLSLPPSLEGQTAQSSSNV